MNSRDNMRNGIFNAQGSKDSAVLFVAGDNKMKDHTNRTNTFRRAHKMFMALLIALTMMISSAVPGVSAFAANNNDTVRVATYDQLQEALEETKGVKEIVVDPQAAVDEGEVVYSVEGDENNNAFYIGFDEALTVSDDITITSADDVDVYFARSDSFKNDQDKPALLNIESEGNLNLDGFITMSGEEVATAFHEANEVNPAEFVFSVKSKDGTGEDNEVWNSDQALKGGFYIQNNGGEYTLGDDVIMEDLNLEDDVEGVEAIFETESEGKLFQSKKNDEEVVAEPEEEKAEEVVEEPKEEEKAEETAQNDGLAKSGKFNASIKGYDVEINVPEGAFKEDVGLVVKEAVANKREAINDKGDYVVMTDEQKAAVDKIEDVAKATVVDVTFANAAGEEVEPAEPVEMQIEADKKALGFDEMEDVEFSIIHIKNEEKKNQEENYVLETVAQTDATDKELKDTMEVSKDKITAEFTVDSFSQFAFAAANTVAMVTAPIKWTVGTQEITGSLRVNRLVNNTYMYNTEALRNHSAIGSNQFASNIDVFQIQYLDSNGNIIPKPQGAELINANAIIEYAPYLYHRLTKGNENKFESWQLFEETSGRWENHTGDVAMTYYETPGDTSKAKSLKSITFGFQGTDLPNENTTYVVAAVATGSQAFNDDVGEWVAGYRPTRTNSYQAVMHPYYGNGSTPLKINGSKPNLFILTRTEDYLAAVNSTSASNLSANNISLTASELNNPLKVISKWDNGGKNNYELVYCADKDASTEILELTYYQHDLENTTKLNLREFLKAYDSNALANEKYERLKIIMGNGYPYAGSSIITDSEDQQRIKMMATQAAIWEVINGNYYGSNPTPSFESISGVNNNVRKAVVDERNRLLEASNSWNTNSSGNISRVAVAEDGVSAPSSSTVKVQLTRALAGGESITSVALTYNGKTYDTFSYTPGNNYFTISGVDDAAGVPKGTYNLSVTVKGGKTVTLDYYETAYYTINAYDCKGQQNLIGAHISSEDYEIGCSNTAKPPRKVVVRKEWVGGAPEGASVTLNLIRTHNGVTTTTPHTLSAANNWKDEIWIYDHDDSDTYEIKEVSVNVSDGSYTLDNVDYGTFVELPQNPDVTVPANDTITDAKFKRNGDEGGIEEVIGVEESKQDVSSGQYYLRESGGPYWGPSGYLAVIGGNLVRVSESDLDSTDAAALTWKVTVTSSNPKKIVIWNESTDTYLAYSSGTLSALSAFLYNLSPGQWECKSDTNRIIYNDIIYGERYIEVGFLSTGPKYEFSGLHNLTIYKENGATEFAIDSTGSGADDATITSSDTNVVDATFNGAKFTLTPNKTGSATITITAKKGGTTLKTAKFNVRVAKVEQSDEKVLTKTITATNKKDEDTEIELTKVDGLNTNTKLGGAEFELYRVNESDVVSFDNDGKPTGINVSSISVKKSPSGLALNPVVEATSEQDTGAVKLGSIEEGTYLLFETKAPGGYQRRKTPWLLHVKSNGSYYLAKYNADKVLYDHDNNSNTPDQEIGIYSADYTGWYETLNNLRYLSWKGEFSEITGGQLLNTPMELEVIKKDSTKTKPLVGVKFNLYKGIEKHVGTGDALHREYSVTNFTPVNGSTPLVSGAEGKFTLPTLEPAAPDNENGHNVYLLYEIDPLTGYEKPNAPWGVLVDKDGGVAIWTVKGTAADKYNPNEPIDTAVYMCTDYVAVNSSVITNDRKPIELYKVDEKKDTDGSIANDATRLGGAKFVVCEAAVDNDGYYYVKNAKNDSDLWVANSDILNTCIQKEDGTGPKYFISESTGDDIGKISIDGLGTGTYFLFEAEAPKGFVRATSPWVIKVKDTPTGYTYTVRQVNKTFKGKVLGVTGTDTENVAADDLSVYERRWDVGVDDASGWFTSMTSPYKLANEPTYLTKVDIDFVNDDNPSGLSGATFKLYSAFVDNTGNYYCKAIDLSSATDKRQYELSSDSEGKISLPLEVTTKPGKYLLFEETAPGGYRKANKPWLLKVNDAGEITIECIDERVSNANTGDGSYTFSKTGTIKWWKTSEFKSMTWSDKYRVPNTINDITLVKVNGYDTSQKLDGAIFELFTYDSYFDNDPNVREYKYKLKNSVGFTSESKNGRFSLPVTEGKYLMFERKAPDGFELSKTPWWIEIEKRTNNYGYVNISVRVIPVKGNNWSGNPSDIWWIFDCNYETSSTVYNYPTVALNKIDLANGVTTNTSGQITAVDTDEAVYLDNVKFKLYKSNSSYTTQTLQTVNGQQIISTTAPKGLLDLGRLDDGYYLLEEYETKDATYIKPTAMWRIRVGDGTKANKGKITYLGVPSGNSYITQDKVDGRYYITNSRVYELPSSGGMGTYWFMIIGAMMMGFALTAGFTKVNLLKLLRR